MSKTRHMRSDRLSINDAAVLKLVQAAARPRSAYDIMELMRPERSRIAPTTVYRALHRLAADGLVHRVETLNAWFAPPASGPREGGIVTICDDCGSVGEFAAPEALAAISGALGTAGFHPDRPVIEVHGRCKPCGEGRA